MRVERAIWSVTGALMILFSGYLTYCGGYGWHAGLFLLMGAGVLVCLKVL